MRLTRTAESVDEIEALVAHAGGRVGAAGVLADLNRRARVRRAFGGPAVWGFTWDRADNLSARWWPQGITTSADAGPLGSPGDREVVVTSSYARVVDRIDQGARVTFVDVTDRGRVRYRHVLLVEAFLGAEGRVGVRPVRLHAGGIVWHGPYLHVAGTGRGISTFRLDDIVSGQRLADGFGYRYLLPVRFTYDSAAADGADKLRYSFLSLDRSGSPYHLVAGEYGRGSQTTRLARYPIDPATLLLGTGAGGTARPVAVDSGVPGMQGAVVVDDRYYVSTSNGRYGRGSLWVGEPGALRQHQRVLPAGCEDLAHWPGRDQLWSLTEYPGRRHVFAMDRSRFG